MSELEPPPGWTVTREQRDAGALEDANSAFTDGHQWTVRDADGQRPPQAEWPSDWHRHALLYAWAVHERRQAGGAVAPNAGRLTYVDPAFGMFDHLHPRTVVPAVEVDSDPADIQETPAAGRVLASKDLTLTETAELCGGAKGVLGVTKDHPHGQLGPDWTWRATWGLGVRVADGRYTESLRLRLTRIDGHQALFLWTRRAVSPALVHAIAKNAARWEVHGRLFRLMPGSFAALVRKLPAPGWKSTLTTSWDRDPGTGHLTDIPRPVPSSTVKKEIRT